MPRDDDRSHRGRPPSRGPGRSGPPRGKRFAGGDERGRDDDGPRGPRKVGGRAFRKAHGDAPRSEGRDISAGGKRFGGAKSGGRTFGDKRPFGDKRDAGSKRAFGSKPGGFRKDGDRPQRGFDRSESRPRKDFERGENTGGERSWETRTLEKRAFQEKPWQKRSAPARDGAARGDRPKFDRPKFDRPRSDRPKFDRPREDRPARPVDGDRGPRKFDRPKFDKPRGERASGDRPRSERPFRDKPRGDRPYGDKPRGDRPYDKRPRDGNRTGERPRFSRDRSERPGNDRPRDERRRNDRVSRSTHAWRDHPRSEDLSAPLDRRDEAPRDEAPRETRREFQQRPAFGGRGAYRERKPFGARDTRNRRDEAVAAPPKKSGERIAKLMARAGLCSRREAEEWIRQGRVAVNGRVIETPALDVNTRDIVAVDGAPLPERERTRLFLYHKPRGLVTTHADPEGRSTIFDALPKALPRLISVGRLDYNTEGLLLLTNDGGLKRVLELPDTGWLRRYRVRAHGAITQERLNTLRDGIEVDGVKYGPIEATLDQEPGANVWITFAIREGKNREVRNVLSHLGLEVNRLIRVSYGPFQLGELAEGEVEEVRGRHLRDQLGERIAREAGADFSLPVRDHGEEAEPAPRPPKPREEAKREPPRRDERQKPRGRTGMISVGREGRRILVQRLGSERPRDDVKPRRPSRPYKGKRDRPPKED